MGMEDVEKERTRSSRWDRSFIRATFWFPGMEIYLNQSVH